MFKTLRVALALGGRTAIAVGLFAAVVAGGCASPLLSGSGGDPASYAAAVRNALQAYAQDMPGYQFRAAPIGNFGVGSLYLEDVGDPGLTQVDKAWYLGGPDVWLRTPAATREQVMTRMIAEGSLGSYSAQTSHDRTVDVQAGVAILSALAANASIDYRRGVTTSFEATEVRNRRLNWAEFENALNGGRIDPTVAKIVREGRFVVVAADIVLIGYRAEVSVDESVNPALAASLRANILFPQLRGASAGFRVSEERQGHFVAVASGPVVAAVLFKRPPSSSKSLGAGEKRPDVDTWPTVAVDDKTLAAVEGRVPGQ